MRFVDLLLLSLVITGCSGSMGWKTVVEKDSPATFAWQGTTLWGSGGATLRRAENGTWERIELCGTEETTPRPSVSIAFEGPAVWALCTQSGIQRLLRHDGSGTATLVELPIDGTLQLLPLLDGAPALLGSRALYQWNGTGWDNKGDHLFANKSAALGKGAGLSANEIYVEGGSSNLMMTMMWWNGTRWQSMLGASAGAPTLRFGKAWSGLLALESGYFTPLAIKGEKALKDKGLTLASLLTLDTLLAVGGRGTSYYSLGVNDTEPVAMGGLAGGDRSGQAADVTVVDVYGNVGQVLSRGDNGSGVAFVYGLDRNTVLVGNVTGGGLGGASAYTTLMQGTR